MFLALAVWYASIPVLRWDRGMMIFRVRPFSRGLPVAPEDVVWRPGATYVGRFLLARSCAGKTVRLPLFLLPRSGARRLFAFLDRR